MRFERIQGGKTLNFGQKLQLIVVKAMAGAVPGPLVTLSHKRNLFGKYFTRFMERAMRGSEEWKKEELELFASFTSRLLHCSY